MGMIAMAGMVSTFPLLDRRAALLGAGAVLGGCVAAGAPPGAEVRVPGIENGAFLMADAAELPFRAWLPEGEPAAVVLALHGFNDSRDAWELLAPAVWGRAAMNWFMQGGLWLAANFAPGLTVSRPPPGVRIVASDNVEALRALGRNPLTIKATRFDTLRGLVDLMDLALAAAGRMGGVPALFLYGGKDTVIPAAATRALWGALPAHALVNGAVRRGFYPGGYHLLPRDLGRAEVIGDILAWVRDPRAALPSEGAAAAWLAG